MGSGEEFSLLFYGIDIKLLEISKVKQSQLKVFHHFFKGLISMLQV